jgi:acyl-CoA synthetase (AMP-forming)/AMP-acid ligase II
VGDSGANPGCGPTGTSPPRYSIAAARTDAFPVLWFGAMKARACLVPINTRLAPPEVVGILRDSGATHLVVGHEFAGIIDEVTEDVGGHCGSRTGRGRSVA